MNVPASPWDDSSELVAALLLLMLLTALLYTALRWGAARVLMQISTGMEYSVDLVAAGLLYPEYLLTRVTRRTSGRAAPFAYTYGDAVCGLACGTHRCLSLAVTVLTDAARHLEHRVAFGISLLSSVLLLYALR